MILSMRTLVILINHHSTTLTFRDLSHTKVLMINMTTIILTSEPPPGTSPMLAMRHPRPVTAQTTITSTFHMWGPGEADSGRGLTTIGASGAEGGWWGGG